MRSVSDAPRESGELMGNPLALAAYEYLRIDASFNLRFNSSSLFTISKLL
jgi:hypothetical protein